MAEELDTSWFDLKNYEAFKTMPATEWQRQLEMRYLYRNAYEERQRHDFVRIFEYCKPNILRSRLENHVETDKYLLSVSQLLKSGAIPSDPNYFDRFQSFYGVDTEDDIFSTTSVNSISSSHLWGMVNEHYELNHIWEICQKRSVGYGEYLGLAADEEMLIFNAHDLNANQYHAAYSSNFAHVNINLLATDEQIKSDFSHWLNHYRQAIGIKTQKKLLSQVDFNYWVKYGIIPYLDLLLIAKIEGKKITQNKLAKLIFPDEYDVDTTGRLRDTTKPEAEWLIKCGIHRVLSVQLAAEKMG